MCLIERMNSAATKKKAPVAIDYPETDNMAENLLQRLMSEFLRPLIQRFLREAMEGTNAKDKRYKSLRAHRTLRVGADQFWYYVEGDTSKCVSPDVYVMAGVDPKCTPPSWKLWELDKPPVFALEIVSKEKKKDYVETPKAYAHTGVHELVVYDPDAPVLSDVSAGQSRVRWQVWRRSSAGRWAKVVQSNADRIESEALSCWLRVVGEGGERLLRVATGPQGDQLFLSGEESERAEKERERAEKEREHTEKELEREEKLNEQRQRKELEAQVQMLKAQLARVGTKVKKTK